MSRTSYKSIYDMEEWELQDEIDAIRNKKQEEVAEKNDLQASKNSCKERKVKYQAVIDKIHRPNVINVLQQRIDPLEQTNKLHSRRISDMTGSSGYEYAAPYLDKLTEKSKKLTTSIEFTQKMLGTLRYVRIEAENKRNELNDEINALTTSINQKRQVIRDLEDEYNQAVWQWDEVRKQGGGY